MKKNSGSYKEHEKENFFLLAEPQNKLHGFQPNMDLEKYKEILDESYSMLEQEKQEEKKRQRLLKPQGGNIMVQGGHGNDSTGSNADSSRKSCMKQQQQPKSKIYDNRLT